MNTSRTLKRITLVLFPVLTLIFAAIYLFNEPLYLESLKEDNLVEWLTFIFLFTSGILSLITAIRIKSRYNYFHWFFIAFFAFNLLAGFEEISWGQRVLNIQSGEFFQRYNDQQETNLHNTFQGVFHIKTKHIALLALFIYGVVLPWMIRRNALNTRWMDKNFIVIPPSSLMLGFLFATLMMLDFQTGYEEEIGEFYFSICFFLFTSYSLIQASETEAFALKIYSKRDAIRPSFKAKAQMAS